MSRESKAVDIRKQLVQLSKTVTELSINELRIILAIERIIARLEDSNDLRDHLIFKGGFVMLKVLASERFTRDLDALCRGINKADAEKLIASALHSELDDGFWFGDIKVENLEAQGEYGALRFDSAFQIGDPPKEKIKFTKLSRVHFDIGFGDKVMGDLTPVRLKSLFPNGEALSWKVYPIEFIFSEKLETLVKRESANSRSKDVYDMTIIFRACKNKEKLVKAIQSTFKTRGTAMPASFSEFAEALNVRQLKSSWGSVQLSTALSFENCWAIFVEQLQGLDAIFK